MKHTEKSKKFKFENVYIDSAARKYKLVDEILEKIEC